MDTPNSPNQMPAAGPPPGGADPNQPSRDQRMQQQVNQPDPNGGDSNANNRWSKFDSSSVASARQEVQQDRRREQSGQETPRPGQERESQQSQQSQQNQQSADPNQPVGDEQFDPNESALIPGMQRPQPEETLFEWQAPERPFKRRTRQSYTTIGLICLLIALILFFAGQFLPVAVIAAAFFVYYVLSSTPPGEITNKLTTYGIRVADNLYYWEEMGRFWITKKYDKNLLHIEVARFPFQLTILLGEVDPENMKAVLSEVLLNQKPEPTTYEKAAKWLQEKLPIDLDS